MTGAMCRPGLERWKELPVPGRCGEEPFSGQHYKLLFYNELRVHDNTLVDGIRLAFSAVGIHGALDERR